MSSHEEYAHLKIPLADIQYATNDFDDEYLIGEGGFGKVYKGFLWVAGHSIVARRLHYDYGQGDLEFWTEIMMLSGLKHRNLVSFVGYCDEKGEKIIINKYESHESLDKYLEGSVLTWLQRLEICVGIARAMNFIHYDVGCNFSVIHRNIKSSKILLNENWEPKLSGFEHAIRNTSERRHRLLLAEVIGTIGYVDPTYEKTGFVTHKSDVYSFGVVLFEILCGRKAFIPDEQEHDSPQIAKADYKEGKADKDNGLLWSFSSDGQPKSFVHARPKSFVLAGPSSYVKSDKQPHSLVSEEMQPSSSTNVRKSLFARVWLSLSNCVRSSPSTDIQPSKYTKARMSSSTNEQILFGLQSSSSNGQPKPFVHAGPSSLSSNEEINSIRPTKL